MSSYDDDTPPFWGLVLGGLLIAFVVFGGIGACAYGVPQYNLYKAETMKREKIAEAKANSDSAEYEAERAVEIAQAQAEADIIRAEGIAEANRLISESLTDEYNQWHAVEQLNPNATTVYVPSDGPLPLPEASRTP